MPRVYENGTTTHSPPGHESFVSASCPTSVPSPDFPRLCPVQGFGFVSGSSGHFHYPIHIPSRKYGIRVLVKIVIFSPRLDM